MSSKVFKLSTSSKTNRSKYRRYDGEVCCCCIPILLGVQILACIVIAYTLFDFSKNIYITIQNPPDDEHFSMDRALYDKHGLTVTYVQILGDVLTFVFAGIVLYGIYMGDHRFLIMSCIFTGIDIGIRIFLIANWCYYANAIFDEVNFLDIPTFRRTQSVIVLCTWILSGVMYSTIEVYFLWILSLAIHVIKEEI